MPLGLLAFCLDYAKQGEAVGAMARPRPELGGVFRAVREQFAPRKNSSLAATLNHIKDFRNEWIAHAKQELTDATLVKRELKIWIGGLEQIYRAHHA